VKYHVYMKYLVKLDNLCNRKGLDKDFDIEDIFFAAREICEWRCSASGKRAANLKFVVWDESKPVNGKNLLLFSEATRELFEKEPAKEKLGLLSPEAGLRVTGLLQRAEAEYAKAFPLFHNFENN